MENCSILISGAGVAGLTFGCWLRHHGFRPAILERATALPDSGYKVDIRGVAIDVIRRMGLLDDIKQAVTGIRGASFVDRTGKRVANMDADLFGGRTGEDVEIMRGDLIRILI